MGFEEEDEEVTAYVAGLLLGLDGMAQRREERTVPVTKILGDMLAGENVKRHERKRSRHYGFPYMRSSLGLALHRVYRWACQRRKYQRCDNLPLRLWPSIKAQECLLN